MTAVFVPPPIFNTCCFFYYTCNFRITSETYASNSIITWRRQGFRIKEKGIASNENLVPRC